MPRNALWLICCSPARMMAQRQQSPYVDWMLSELSTTSLWYMCYTLTSGYAWTDFQEAYARIYVQLEHVSNNILINLRTCMQGVPCCTCICLKGCPLILHACKHIYNLNVIMLTVIWSHTFWSACSYTAATGHITAFRVWANCELGLCLAQERQWNLI